MNEDTKKLIAFLRNLGCQYVEDYLTEDGRTRCIKYANTNVGVRIEVAQQTHGDIWCPPCNDDALPDQNGRCSLCGATLSPLTELLTAEWHWHTGNGNHVRKATMVILPNGKKIQFTERLSKSDALRMAIDAVRQHPDLWD